MGAENLKQALDDCLINFDRRVLLTDLHQEYKLPFTEIDGILSKYVAEQEKQGTKFEKRFLVSGEENDNDNEIYTVVQGESNLQEWRRKLKNAEVALYSLEIAGGAKAVAEIFKPMKWCVGHLENVETRPAMKWKGSAQDQNSNNRKAAMIKTEPTQNNKSVASVPAAKVNKTETAEKKTSPESKNIKSEPKLSPPEEKKPSSASAKNQTSKKGIASFFTSGSSAVKTEAKKASGVIKPPTPKKMQDFFKKNDKVATPVSKAEKVEKATAKANESMQLFNEEDSENEVELKENSHPFVAVDTDDDEEELKALRKQCSEQEEPEEAAAPSSSRNKRRRISDSDDEEPDVKHEKVDEEKEVHKKEHDEANKAESFQSESFIDEDGFVVTKKPKKAALIKKPTKPKSPEKPSPKEESSKKGSTKATPKSAAKTKQGNIMNFFSKK